MNVTNQDYKAFIEEIKSKVKASQIKASIKVNEELLRLYWDIAKMVVTKQKEANWGEDFIGQISRDLKKEFPDIKGFSVTNIKYMRQWYLFWIKSQQVVDQIFKTDIL